MVKVWIKSIEIDNISDVMRLTPGSSGFINVLYLRKCLSESSKTFCIESLR